MCWTSLLHWQQVQRCFKMTVWYLLQKLCCLLPDWSGSTTCCRYMHFPPETASVMILARIVATVQQADDPSSALDLFMQVKCWTLFFNGTVRQGRRMWRVTCHRMVKVMWEIIVLTFSLLSLVRNTVFCQGYAIGGSKTGNISQDIVSWDRFFHKHNVKIRRIVPDTILTKRKDMYTYEKWTNYEIW